ncbi:Ankyrin-3 [Pseudocercospora fuligena]|uniref:Ankyrin-3 n=1 Tax=Pseudocercospora fuligena TaxID=685502 RepID=A0A8H6VJ59_9PEZI|nr:Ankyrin-3 [Pseudocercospora fuligena]
MSKALDDDNLAAATPNATGRIVDAPSQAYRRELALLEAAEYGQLQRVKRFLDAGNVDVDFVDSTGRAALHFAAREGRLDIVNALIAANCDVDASSKTYGTALCLAASRSHRDVVNALLEAGADVKAPGGGLGSALHAACRAGDSELVDLFLQDETPFDVVRTVDNVIMTDGAKNVELTKLPEGQNYNYSQQQPIHVAAGYGSTKIVQTLLDLGADVDARSRSWFSPEEFGTFESAADNHKSDGISVLHQACRRGQSDVVELLLKRGADPNAKPITSTRGTPLVFAAHSKNLRCVSLVLEAGDFVNEATSAGWTALHSAVHEDRLDSAKLLLDRGANIEAKAKGGVTSMFYVKSPAMVDLLIQRGAVVNYRTPEHGLTPISFVSGWQDNSSTIIEKMIQLGAGVDFGDRTRSSTALFSAVMKERRENALTLLRMGANPRKLSLEYQNKLKGLIGDLPALRATIKKPADPKKNVESKGLFRRLVQRQKAGPSEGAGSQAEVQDFEDVDDDEVTLCGDSASVISKV